MKNALALTPMLLALAIVALVVAEWGDNSGRGSIFRNGVFLTEARPDVPRTLPNS